MQSSGTPNTAVGHPKHKKYWRFLLIGLAIACLGLVIYRAQTRGRGERSMQWDDPLDPVAITVGEIASGERDILLVIRDEGHGGWQFYDGEDVSQRKPFIIPKTELVEIGPSVMEVVDLPVGWRAERRSKNHPWVRSRSFHDRD
jgi:hypothetical protein